MGQDLRHVLVSEKPVYQSDSGFPNYIFKVQRFFSGKDLSTLTAYLKIRFQDESTDKILLSDVTFDQDFITINFATTDALTRVSGRAKCQLCFENVDTTTVINSEVFTIEILDSVQVDSYGQTILPSAIRLLQIDLQQKIEIMNDKIQNVNNFFQFKDVLLGAINFQNGTQSLTVDGVTADSFLLIAPQTNHKIFYDSGIFLAGQGDGYITVKYNTAPTNDIAIRVLIVNKIDTLSL